MIRDKFNSVRASVSDRRVRRAFGVVALCILLSVSFVPMAPVGTVAAQEELPACNDGPPLPNQEESEEGSDELEVALAFDTSNSMAGQPIEDAREAGQLFVGNLEYPDEAAVSKFEGDNAEILHGLSTNYTSVNDSIESMNAQSSVVSNFQFGPGINLTADELLNGEAATDGASKAMVIMTDSESEHQEAIDAGEAARQKNITVYAIGLGTNVNETFLAEITGSSDRVHVAPDSSDLNSVYEEVSEDVTALGGGLTIETRQLFQPGETHGYTVKNYTYYRDGTVEVQNVTSEATINTTNASLLTGDNLTATLTATTNASATGGVVVTAEHAGESGCVNVVVAEASMENLDILPAVWRIMTFLGDWTTFLLIIAIGAGIVGARGATAFMGLSMMELVIIVGWFGGYIGRGLTLVSVFACVFIGLNLAANIDYSVQR